MAVPSSAEHKSDKIAALLNRTLGRKTVPSFEPFDRTLITAKQADAWEKVVDWMPVRRSGRPVPAGVHLPWHNWRTRVQLGVGVSLLRIQQLWKGA